MAGLNALTTEATCRQTAGCNAGTAGAYGHRAGCNRPAEHFRLANLKAGKWQAYGHRAGCNRPAEHFRHLKAGKWQA